MENENFVTILGFMRKELNLKGNELIVYSVIYGFSQDGNSVFSGTKQYLADWCGCTARQVQTILSDLVEKGLLIKEEVKKNNVAFYTYKCKKLLGGRKNFLGGEVDFQGGEKTSYPQEEISPNIDNYIDNNNIIINNSFKKKEIKENYIKEKKKEELFNTFWALYPKKADKKKAMAIFNRLSQADKQNAINGLYNYVNCKKVKDGYILLPTTYLNGRRWEDEMEMEKTIIDDYNEIGSVIDDVWR